MGDVALDGMRGREEPVPSPYPIPMGQGFTAQLYHPVHPVVQDPQVSTFGHLAAVTGLLGISMGWLVPPFGLVVGAIAVDAGVTAVRRAQRHGHLGLFLGLSTIALSVAVWTLVW